MTKIMAERKILILGIGNTLLADEGFGVRALNFLRDNYIWPDNVSLLDGATMGLMLMGDLLECDLAIILDIAQAGGAPGSFYEVEIESSMPSLPFRQSMHQASIADVLASCELAGHRPMATAFCMEPFDCETPRESLSLAASANLSGFCSKVVARLAKMGINAIIKHGDD